MESTKLKKKCAAKQKIHLPRIQECAAVYKHSAQLRQQSKNILKTLKAIVPILERGIAANEFFMEAASTGRIFDFEVSCYLFDRFDAYQQKQTVLLDMIPNFPNVSKDMFDSLTTIPNSFEKKNQNDLVQVFPCSTKECRGFCQVFHPIALFVTCPLCWIDSCVSCQTQHAKDVECDKPPLALENTKPCPVCFVSVERSIGCDEMTCIACHTSFDWETRQIQALPPHEMEHMGRHVIDVDMLQFLAKLNVKCIKNESLRQDCFEFRNNLEHIQARIIKVFVNLPSNEMDYMFQNTSSLFHEMVIDPRKYWTQYGCSDLQVQFVAGFLTEKQLETRSLKRYTEFKSYIESMSCLLTHNKELLQRLQEDVGYLKP